ncbi:MAG: hypothetical protein ABEJ69_02330 [Candidatus Nanohaloarchaea archaeon]
MGPLRFDVLGLLDIFSGALMFFTVAPVPAAIANAHIGFLVFKGSGGMIRGFPMPYPVFLLGGFADIVSASIIHFGQPPAAIGFHGWISAALLVKGIWTLMGLMG